MAALLDTGFLYATLDRADKNHPRVVDTLSRLVEEIVLPTVVLVETTYLIQARLGRDAMRRFVQQLQASPLRLVAVERTDLPRIFGILEQDADLRLDFVDAANIAIAERLRIRKILTVDQRDFQVVKPNHCDYFEIAP
jgi:predicted nucleic acid-binding protein